MYETASGGEIPHKRFTKLSEAMNSAFLADLLAT
jgi:hypothetical protein